MSELPLFVFQNDVQRRRAQTVLRGMPALEGRPLRLEWAPGLRDRHGAVHAGSFLRERRIAFDCARAEFPRIFVHEVAHFIWVRLGNERRRSFERVLRGELAVRTRGELGWSAEWRKAALRNADIEGRTRRWREYCCESFCDTAAWLFSGVEGHEEFTLGRRGREARRAWFRRNIGDRALSI